MQEIIATEVDEVSGYEERLRDKHWEECWQIALYDDQLKKAMKLLDKVSEVHYAALHSGCNEVTLLSGAYFG